MFHMIFGNYIFAKQIGTERDVSCTKRAFSNFYMIFAKQKDTRKAIYHFLWQGNIEEMLLC